MNTYFCNAFSNVDSICNPESIISLINTQQLQQQQQPQLNNQNNTISNSNNGTINNSSDSSNSNNSDNNNYTLPSKCGSWISPFTSSLVTTDLNNLLELYEPTDLFSFWLEARPSEQGRFVVVQVDNYNDTNQRDLIPNGFNARSRVHEYGGTPIIFLNLPNSMDDSEFKIIFSNFRDQALYLHYPHRNDTLPIRITHPDSMLRFVDGTYDRGRNRVIYVAEDHTNTSAVENYLVSLDLNTLKISILDRGYDFYSYPRINSEGTKLAYICWNIPNMPWDDTNLFIANIDQETGMFSSKHVISSNGESVLDPKWSLIDSNVLYFISDRTQGFWTIHRYKDGVIELIIPPGLIHYKEIGEPLWFMGKKNYDILPDDRIIATADNYIIDFTYKNGMKLYENQFSYARSIAASRTKGENITISLLGGSPIQTNTLVRIDSIMIKPFNNSNNQIDQNSTTSDTDFQQHIGPNRSTDDIYKYQLIFTKILQNPIEYDSRFISIPQLIKFNTTDGMQAYAFYYPPTNPLYKLEEVPPLLVKSHGGPTDYSQPVLNFVYQYWTSRGFSVLDVNYRGSSGYGREYRKSLYLKWGIYDVDDCCQGALHLVNEGKADKNSLLIDGMSAGGFTTLASLTFRNVFKGGCSYFGIGNLVSLFKETHKFESHYQDLLLGGFGEVYESRSPINFITRLSVPVAFFHGSEDKVVPPSQSLQMYQHLKSQGIKTYIKIFNGEGHGFLSGQHNVFSLEGEYYFYSKILNFTAQCIDTNQFDM